MKNCLLPSLGLLILLLAACAPAAISPESPVQPPVAAEPTATPILNAEEQPSSSTDVVAAPTEDAPSAPLPIATSRGPNLEATDPSTVSLASGGLQFVEFFRFT